MPALANCSRWASRPGTGRRRRPGRTGRASGPSGYARRGRRPAASSRPGTRPPSGRRRAGPCRPESPSGPRRATRPASRGTAPRTARLDLDGLRVDRPTLALPEREAAVDQADARGPGVREQPPDSPRVVLTVVVIDVDLGRRVDRQGARPRAQASLSENVSGLVRACNAWRSTQRRRGCAPFRSWPWAAHRAAAGRIVQSLLQRVVGEQRWGLGLPGRLRPLGSSTGSVRVRTATQRICLHLIISTENGNREIETARNRVVGTAAAPAPKLHGPTQGAARAGRHKGRGGRTCRSTTGQTGILKVSQGGADGAARAGSPQAWVKGEVGSTTAAVRRVDHAKAPEGDAGTGRTAERLGPVSP